MYVWSVCTYFIAGWTLRTYQKNDGLVSDNNNWRRMGHKIISTYRKRMLRHLHSIIIIVEKKMISIDDRYEMRKELILVEVSILTKVSNLMQWKKFSITFIGILSILMQFHQTHPNRNSNDIWSIEHWVYVLNVFP